MKLFQVFEDFYFATYSSLAETRLPLFKEIHLLDKHNYVIVIKKNNPHIHGRNNKLHS